MATVLNVTEILKRSDGTEVKISGDSKFYAQNNYANLILLDIEDGGSLEACALINFTQQTRQVFYKPQLLYEARWYSYKSC